MYVGRALIEYGEYSEKEWLLLAQLCQAGHVVVEVGANTGVHTVSLAKAVGPNGLVIAIEPQPFVYQNLCANIALNSLTNVVAMQCGCAERPGQLIVPPIDYAKTGNFGGVSLHETGPGTRIDVHRLDDLFRWPTLRLLKIDVEGMEQKVLSGAQHAIEKFKPTLYVENDRVANSPSLIEFLWDLGYSMWWHITPLFDNENYFKEKENIYGTVASINMLCIHRDHKANIAGLPAVTDSIYHPLSQPKGGLADASVPPPQSIRVKR
jgi:FkbM family methyltransferase